MKMIGAGILAIEKIEGKILLGRRGMKGNNPNTWAPFGGTFDNKDEIPRNTAIREFVEETKCSEKFLMEKMPFYICEDNHVKFYSYVGIFKFPFIPQLNSENLEFGWFDFEKLPENLHPGVQEMFDKKYHQIKDIILTIKSSSINIT